MPRLRRGEGTIVEVDDQRAERLLTQGWSAVSTSSHGATPRTSRAKKTSKAGEERQEETSKAGDRPDG